MAPPKANAKTVSYRRTHNLLLASRLLNQRDAPSPFTLVLDSLNQSGRPLVKEYIRRAQISKIKVIFVAFDCIHPPVPKIDVFITGRQKSLQQLSKEIISHTTPQSQSAANTTPATPQPLSRCLIIIDSIHSLCIQCQRQPSNRSQAQQQQQHISSFLASLLSPSTTLLAIYHTDIPLPQPSRENTYTPKPLTLLKYLCTTMITIHSPWQIFEQKRAVDRSLLPPSFGVGEGVEGVVMSLMPSGIYRNGGSQEMGIGGERERGVENNGDSKGEVMGVDGVILELEHRRKSGRGVVEWYYLPPLRLPSTSASTSALSGGGGGGTGTANITSIAQYKERIILLEDHPLFTPEDVGRKTMDTTEDGGQADGGSGGDDILNDGLTFSLSLTDKQKKDREGIVLPYFDAQKEGGGMGGRILYVPGREDDWDEEEDEI